MDQRQHVHNTQNIDKDYRLTTHGCLWLQKTQTLLDWTGQWNEIDTINFTLSYDVCVLLLRYR